MLRLLSILYCLIIFTGVKGQDNYGEVIDLNFYEFTADNKVESTTEFLQFNSGSQLHPEYGINPHNTQCTECFEELNKRTVDSRYYIKKGTNGNIFYVQKSHGPIHYQNSKNEWLTLDYRLRDNSGIPGYFQAKHQKNPVFIDLNSGESGIDLGQGNILLFNQNSSIYISGNKNSHHIIKNPNPNYHAGDDGTMEIDLFNDIDRQQIVKRGAIKTNYIVNKLHSQIPKGQFLVIEDEIILPIGFSIQFDPKNPPIIKDSLYYGDLIISDSKRETKATIHAPKISDGNNNGHNHDKDVIYYRLNEINGKFYLLTYISGDWLNNQKRVFPITVDPLISANANYPSDIGFENNAVCFNPVNYCSTILNVSVPGGSTLTDAMFSAGYASYPNICQFDCDLNEAGIRIYGPCSNVYSPTNTYYTCTGSTPGACSFVNMNIFNNVICAPLSCGNHSLDFEMRTYHCSCSGPSCGQNCHKIGSGSWIITIEARTIEMSTLILSGKDTICYGETVILHSSANFGVPPYTYLWSYNNLIAPNIGFIPDSNDRYYVTITDSCGNSAIDSLYVWVNPLPQLFFNNIIPSCTGLNTGGATVFSNTPGPYQYTWNSVPAQFTKVATGLAPGDYIVTVTDGNGCTNEDTVTITLVPSALIISKGGNDVSCYGANDGMAYIDIINGSLPINIEWNTIPPSFTDTIQFLSGGTYRVTVSDNQGCIIIDSVTVIEPPQINVSINTDSSSCFGISDGQAITTVNGGTQPYSYLWNTVPSNTNPSLINVFAGNYSLTVSDSRNCSVVTQAIIDEPNQIILNLSSINATCGFADGSATASVSGGQAPYTYLWNTIPPQSTSSIFNLAAGNYSVTVTDSENCTESGTVSVVQPGNMNLIINKTDVTCNGFSDGTAIVTVNGGLAPFSYLWNTIPPSISQSISNLAIGSYSVTVTDANNCNQFATFSINQPQVLTSNAQITGISCNGLTDGSIELSPTGGKPGYNYVWNVAPPNTDSVISNLGAGNYTVTITDLDNCKDTLSFQVIEPIPITVNFNITDETCGGINDGQISVTASGGTGPYSYIWNTVPQQTGQVASNLPAGQYTVTVTDANNCIYSDIAGVGIINEILLNANIINVSCFGFNVGQISLNPSGGISPYTYIWFDGSTGNSVSGIPAGNYKVTVSDQTGCTGIGDIMVSEPLPVQVDAGMDLLISQGQSILIQASVNLPGPYIYLWTPSSGLSSSSILQPSASPNFTTVYYLTATDNNGCSGWDSVLISVLPDYDLTLPNAFTPNGDGINDVFFSVPNAELISIEIYNRWGIQVYNGNNPWDGTYQGNIQPLGVYAYRVLVRYPGTETDIIFRGNCTLIR